LKILCRRQGQTLQRLLHPGEGCCHYKDPPAGASEDGFDELHIRPERRPAYLLPYSIRKNQDKRYLTLLLFMLFFYEQNLKGSFYEVVQASSPTS
jgi:hypothetical protein